MPIEICGDPQRGDMWRSINCSSCLCIEVVYFVLGNSSSFFGGAWSPLPMGTLMPQPGAHPEPWHCKSSAPASDTESGCWIQLRCGPLGVLQLCYKFQTIHSQVECVCVLFGVMFSSDEWWCAAELVFCPISESLPYVNGIFVTVQNIGLY